MNPSWWGERNMAENVDEVMQSIPAEWRTRWCGGEKGACACMGCVQIGNRLIMTGSTASQCDPEYIDERLVPRETYKKYKVTKEEWAAWLQAQKFGP